MHAIIPPPLQSGGLCSEVWPLKMELGHHLIVAVLKKLNVIGFEVLQKLRFKNVVGSVIAANWSAVYPVIVVANFRYNETRKTCFGICIILM